jgi:methylase of polypeptide subunit release factors
VLDLCSGTGILGLASAGQADVVSTDIFPAALSLIEINAALNGPEAERSVVVLNEDIRDTLNSDRTFDLVTCNPPFVPFPEGLDGPLYADGKGGDGLGYLRLLIEKTPRILNEKGEGLFVSDLPGDAEPYFFSELKEAAESKNLTIDAYVDSRVPVTAHIETLSSFVARVHPECPEAVHEKVSRLISETLKARYYYLTTVRLSKSLGAPGKLRIFNRHSLPV